MERCRPVPLTRLPLICEVLMIIAISLETIALVFCLIAVFVRLIKQESYNLFKLVKAPGLKTRFILYRPMENLGIWGLGIAGLSLPLMFITLSNIRGHVGIGNGRIILGLQSYMLPGLLTGWTAGLSICYSKLGEQNAPFLCTRPILSNLVNLFPFFFTAIGVPVLVLSNHFQNLTLDGLKSINPAQLYQLENYCNVTIKLWICFNSLFLLAAVLAVGLMSYILSVQYSSSSYLVFKVSPIVSAALIPMGLTFCGVFVGLISKPALLLPSAGPEAIYFQLATALATGMTQITIQFICLFLAIRLKSKKEMEANLFGQLKFIE